MGAPPSAHVTYPSATRLTRQSHRMCAIGSSTNSSIAATSAQATGLGAAGAIGGTLLTGARRVNAGRRPGTVLAGSPAPGGGGGGASPPRSPTRPNIVEY